MKTQQLFDRYNPVAPETELTPRARAELRRLTPRAEAAPPPAPAATLAAPRPRPRRLVPVAAVVTLAVVLGAGYALLTPGGANLATADTLTGRVVAVAPDGYGTSITFSLGLAEVTGLESYLVFKLWTRTEATAGLWTEVGETVTFVHSDAGAYDLQADTALPFDVSLWLFATEEELRQHFVDAEGVGVWDCVERTGAGLEPGESTEVGLTWRGDEPALLIQHGSKVLMGATCPALAGRPEFQGSPLAGPEESPAAGHAEVAMVVELDRVGEVLDHLVTQASGQFYTIGATGTDEAGLQAELARYVLDAAGRWVDPPADRTVGSPAEGDAPDEGDPPAPDFDSLAAATAYLEAEGFTDRFAIVEKWEPLDWIHPAPAPHTVSDVTCWIETGTCEVKVAAGPGDPVTVGPDLIPGPADRVTAAQLQAWLESGRFEVEVVAVPDTAPGGTLLDVTCEPLYGGRCELTVAA
jgi:hypothetical protein